jgi:hypothetical protein
VYWKRKNFTPSDPPKAESRGVKRKKEKVEIYKKRIYTIDEEA